MNEKEIFETQIASLRVANSRLIGQCMAYEVVLGALLRTSPYAQQISALLSTPGAQPEDHDNPDAERAKSTAQALRRLQSFAS